MDGAATGLGPRGFQADAFLPWVDYIGLLWALLMAEQQPGPEYQALIDINRQRLGDARQRPARRVYSMNGRHAW